VDYLSKIAARNSRSQALLFNNGKIEIKTPQNYVFKPLLLMVFILLWTTAGVFSAYSFEKKPEFGFIIFLSSFGLAFFAGFAYWFIRRFLQKGAIISKDGIRITSRIKAPGQTIRNAKLIFKSRIYMGVAATPKLIIRYRNNSEHTVKLDGCFNGFFPALMILQQWHEGNFSTDIDQFHIAGDKKAKSKKRKRDKSSVKPENQIKLHALAKPEELLKSDDKTVKSETEDGKRKD
jgi:hypothetical protein